MKTKALVVDNNITQLGAAMINLKSLGYNVFTANSYVDARKLIAEQGSEKFDAIMTCLFLPKESTAGSEFTQPRGLGLVIDAFMDNILVVLYTSRDYNDSYVDGIIRSLLSHNSDKKKEIPFLTGKSWMTAWSMLNRLINQKND